MSKKNLLSIAVHEAGHAVIERLLFPDRLFLGVSIKVKDLTLGRTTSEDLGEFDFIENEIIVLLAGYFAQIRFDPKSEKIIKKGAKDDFEKARYLSRKLGSNKKTIPINLKIKTQEHIKENWKKIMNVANELLKFTDLDGEEVDLIIEYSQHNKKAKGTLRSLRQLKGNKTRKN